MNINVKVMYDSYRNLIQKIKNMTPRRAIIHLVDELSELEDMKRHMFRHKHEYDNKDFNDINDLQSKIIKKILQYTKKYINSLLESIRNGRDAVLVFDEFTKLKWTTKWWI